MRRCYRRRPTTIVITQKQIAGENTVTIDMFDGSAFNPSVAATTSSRLTIEGPTPTPPRCWMRRA